jgi:hypothetical protein
MKFTRFALLAVMALVGTVACSDDPTDVGSGEPFAIVTNRSTTTVARNTQFTITAYTIDQNNRRIPGALAASSAGPAVTLDSVVYVQELSETRVFARGVAASANGTDIQFSGQGLTATTKVIVN